MGRFRRLRRPGLRAVGLALALVLPLFAPAPGLGQGVPGAPPAPDTTPAPDTAVEESGRRRRPPPTALGATLEGNGFALHFAPADSLRAALVFAALEQQQPLPALAPEVPTGVTVILAPDEATFRRAAGGRPPEWSAAVAIPSLNRIVLPPGGSERMRATSWLQVIRHEWAHIGLRQSLPGLRVPRWFDEGYAQWAAGWNRGDAWRLRVWVAMGRTPPLDSLTFRWPGDRASAEGAYLLAATTVEYLVSASGDDALALFIRRWREGGRFDPAMRRIYGVTSSQLEEDWRSWLKGRYGWLSVLGQSSAAWLVLALLLLAMVRLRRRHDVERVAALRADEPPDAPAWWDPHDDDSGTPTGRSPDPGPAIPPPTHSGWQ